MAPPLAPTECLEALERLRRQILEVLDNVDEAWSRLTRVQRFLALDSINSCVMELGYSRRVFAGRGRIKHGNS